MIVTGAATGIGRSVALRSAVYGAKVSLFDVNDSDGEETVNDIAESGGCNRQRSCLSKTS